MFDVFWIAAIALGAGLFCGYLVWPAVRPCLHRPFLADARHLFHLNREWLEFRFVRLAAEHSQREEIIWFDADFDNDVLYVRNRMTGQLSAFVAFSVRLENFEGDDAPPVRQTGTAVFRFARDRWDTFGVALMNFTPAQTVLFYQASLELLEQEIR